MLLLKPGGIISGFQLHADIVVVGLIQIAQEETVFSLAAGSQLLQSRNIGNPDGALKVSGPVSACQRVASVCDVYSRKTGSTVLSVEPHEGIVFSRIPVSIKLKVVRQAGVFCNGACVINFSLINKHILILPYCRLHFRGPCRHKHSRQQAGGKDDRRPLF
ncbi:hypothetical protein D3C75_818610 [compost metagenome]